MIVQKNPAFRVKSVDIGKTYSVMNGKSSINVAVTEPMVGFRFGQFVLTKRLGSTIHIKKKVRKAQSKKSR
jgi:ribosomal protein S19